MAERIEDLLQRRGDLSTFLVHLSRDFDGSSARDNLIAMLCDVTIEAKSPMGMAVGIAGGDPTVLDTQRVVCLTETPLEHVWMLVRDIAQRQVQLRPYGLAFTKVWARRRGVNPVWYIDATPGHDWLTGPINDLLVDTASGRRGVWNAETNAYEPEALAAHPLTQVTPFFEQMGTWDGRRKEFWWEREWRHVGNLYFNWPDVVAVFVPEADHVAFRADLTDARQATREWFCLLDPVWGLERMIAALAGIDHDLAGPLP